jgi:hypothetical protein
MFQMTPIRVLFSHCLPFFPFFGEPAGSSKYRIPLFLQPVNSRIVDYSWFYRELNDITMPGKCADRPFLI